MYNILLTEVTAPHRGASWPAAFDRVGGLGIQRAYHGRPAIVDTDDGLVYAVYKGHYHLCGEMGKDAVPGARYGAKTPRPPNPM